MSFQPQPHTPLKTARTFALGRVGWVQNPVLAPKVPVPSQPLVAFWRLCWLLITARVQSRSKLKTTLARLITIGIIAGAGLAVCHLLFFSQRNGQDKVRNF